MNRKIRSCIISPEIVGPHNNGGVGTHSYYLSAFLSRELGEEVTFLYTGWIERHDEKYWREWFHRHLGLEFVWLPRPERLESVPPALRCSYLNVAGQVYRWLQKQSFDVCHFQEMHGNGFRCFQAKRLGLAFANTVLTCTVHSSWEWICQAMQAFPQAGIEELQTKFIERYCIEHCDLLLSPSQHMLDWLDRNDVKTPGKRFILPYLFDPELKPVGCRKPNQHLVFFGRLEVRKGLILFLETILALDRERAFGDRPLKVTFLGRAGYTPDGTGLDTIKKYREQFSPCIILEERTDLGQPQALEFLAQQKDALVVCPSLIDNSPYAIIESLQLGLNLIAAKSGGIPELFAGEERLFEPEPKALAAKIRAGLNNELPPPTKRYDLQTSARMWRDFCEKAVPEASQPRPQTAARAEFPGFKVFVSANQPVENLVRTLEALRRQTFRSFSSIVVRTGNGPGLSEVALRAACEEYRCQLIEATPGGVHGSRGGEANAQEGVWAYGVFISSGCYPHANMLASLASAIEGSDADALSSCVQIIPAQAGQDAFVFEPLGAFLEGGVFRNFFGAGFFALRKAAVTENLAELWKWLKPEGAWACLAGLSLAGKRHEVVPEALAELDRANAALTTLDLGYDGQMEVLKGYRAGLPVWLHYLFLDGVSTERQRLALNESVVRNGSPSAAINHTDDVRHGVGFKIKRETKRFLRQCWDLPRNVKRQANKWL